MSEQLLTFEAAIQLHHQVHSANPGVFAGFSLKTFIGELGFIIKHSNLKTVLDYGCGKGKAWQRYSLQDLWNLQRVDLYDPAVPQYSTKPTTPSDLVLCIDVLEHIPEQSIDKVMDELNFYTSKLLFVNIATIPAGKILPNGMNAHLTVKPKDWWLKKLERVDKLVISHFS